MMVPEALKIFIGWDPIDVPAYHVLSHSLITRASLPISITPVKLRQLEGVFTRERGLLEATEFSISRFLVPALSGYRGWSLWMDPDMLCLTDITRLWAHIAANPDKALLCCKHEYIPKAATKMGGLIQTAYPRKNWSSFMLMNNERCKALTVDYVNTAAGSALHQFHWLRDDDIGALPLEWNWLVGEYDYNPHAYVQHYTLGGPWLVQDRSREADIWREEAELAHELVAT